METRDILNQNGMKIGELTLPSDTPENVWEERLFRYAVSGLPTFSNVTASQLRKALVLSNISMEYVDAALDSLPEPTKTLAKISWEYETSFARHTPLADQVAQLLNLSSDQLDDLWLLALSL